MHWYTPTNATLWMALAVIAVSLLLIAGSRGRALVPSRGQSVAELVYGFGRKMVEDVAGMADAMREAGRIDPARCRAVARERFAWSRTAALYLDRYAALVSAAAAAP